MEEIPDPEWLNKNILIHILRSVEKNDKVELKSWSCALAVPAGSNYLSQLYRVTIDYKVEYEDSSHSITLIVKEPVMSGGIKELADSLKGYEREVKIYQEVLPSMYEVHSCRLTARSFDCPMDNFLVLEDLKEKGYIMVNRLKQLDAAHCRQALVALAKFHALSVAAYHKYPNLIQDIGVELSNPHNNAKYTKMIIFYFNALIHTIENLDGGKHFIEIHRKEVASFSDKLERILKFEDGLKVLIHGDAWLNNILFKYNDNGEVADIKLVDFQLCKYCSFAQDVIFFWFTSANEDVRENNKEELFEAYRQTLNQTLEETECIERLSKEEFDCQIRNYAPYALVAVATVMTLVMADPDNLVDFSNFTVEDLAKPVTDDSPILRNLRSKYFKSALPGVLRQLEAFGAFT